jgi:hypothetical protein
MGTMAALTAIPDMLPEQREKEVVRAQIPLHKAHGGVFYAFAICHHEIHNSSPSLTTRTLLQGSPRAVQTPWQPNNTQQGEDRWENPAKQTQGVTSSESKIHWNPLIGNNSKSFRHYVVTIRCKHRISDLQKTECFCSIFVRTEFNSWVLKFPSTTQCELKSLPFNNIAGVRFWVSLFRVKQENICEGKVQRKEQIQPWKWLGSSSHSGLPLSSANQMGTFNLSPLGISNWFGVFRDGCF